MKTPPPQTWFLELLGIDAIDEGQKANAHGVDLIRQEGILRSADLASAAQQQTSDAFGYKWSRRETYEGEQITSRTRDWLRERYGDIEGATWWDDYGEAPVMLDAGCGAGFGAIGLLAERIPAMRYIGADISTAVDVAAARFAERGLPGSFLQSTLTRLPFAEGSLDVILSEGVLHHTDDTEASLKSLATLLRPGGRLMFYVYRRKGPIREFTDDLVRERLRDLPPEQAWEQMRPLTLLGKALGELDAEIDVPEDIELLDIPAGRIDVQRLFYWHVAKAFYDPQMTIEEMNHINYDWYAPRNAHRHSPDEVRAWCVDAGLEIEHENVQDAGITVVARKLVA